MTELALLGGAPIAEKNYPSAWPSTSEKNTAQMGDIIAKVVKNFKEL